MAAPPAFGAHPDQALLGAEYDNMLACIRCGLCLTSCPTYVLSMHESEGPRGRVGIGRALTEGHLSVTSDLVEHELNCLVCDACSAVCPAGVHMDPIQVVLRTAIEPHTRRPFRERLLRRVVFGWLFMDMRRFRLLARLMWVYQRSGIQSLARTSRLLGLLRLEATERLLPRVPRQFFVPRGETHAARTASGHAPAAMFAGCVMSTALADVDRATVRVLTRAGFTVSNPQRQGCCGALHAHSGDLERFLVLVRRNIEAFEASEGPVVVNSAGCGAMLKDYGHHLRDDPAWSERAHAFSARVRDVTEVLEASKLETSRAVNARVVYQDACHLLHAQRIRSQPRALLQRLAGVQVMEIAEAGLCCGSAGVYNLTNPSQSRQLQQRKVDHVLAAAPDVVVTANPGCLFQLQSGLQQRGSRVQVRHLVDLLDEASR